MLRMSAIFVFLCVFVCFCVFLLFYISGRPFIKRFALCYRTVVCLSCLSACLSVTLMYCGQTVGWIKMKLGTDVGLGPGHIVLHGDPAPARKGHGRPPFFGSCLLWPNGRPSQLLLSTCTVTYWHLAKVTAGNSLSSPPVIRCTVIKRRD